jgi:hypothetical protein
MGGYEAAPQSPHGGDLNIFEGKQLGLGHGMSRGRWGLVESNLQSGARTNSCNTRNSFEISISLILKEMAYREIEGMDSYAV